MLIRIYTYIVVKDLIRFQNVHCMMVALVKKIIMFGVDMTSSFHINNKKKDILIAGIGSKQGLDDTTLTAEAKYLINFSNKRSDKICISKILYKNLSLQSKRF